MILFMNFVYTINTHSVLTVAGYLPFDHISIKSPMLSKIASGIGSTLTQPRLFVFTCNLIVMCFWNYEYILFYFVLLVEFNSLNGNRQPRYMISINLKMMIPLKQFY